MRTSSLVFLALGLISVVACGDGLLADAAPYTVRGWTLDGRGEPLSDVDIVVDNSILYNATVSGRTDADGWYELSVDDGSWQVYATHHADYHQRTFEVELHPLDGGSFAGVDGAVCSFEWRLEGEKPEPLAGTYGGTVHAYVDASVARYADLELTLEPVGPLIDGSEGTTLVRTPDAGGLVEDVPIGQYTISARDTRQGRDLLLRLQTDDGPAQASVTTVFEPLWERELCADCIRLELEAP